jgi:membrane protein required for colicin V production
MDALTTFDIIVGLMIGIGAVRGVMRGFVGELASLGAWVAGFLAVRFLFTPAKALLTPYTDSEAGAAVLALAILFMGTFFIVRVIGAQLSDAAQDSIVGPFDRLLGLGFGAAKGVLASVLMFLAIIFGLDALQTEKPPEWLARAKSGPTLAMLSRTLGNFVDEMERLPADAAAADPQANPHRGVPGFGNDDGYQPDDRSKLDELLDKQERASPSTPI